jgi:hypothetical protein
MLFSDYKDFLQESAMVLFAIGKKIMAALTLNGKAIR